MTCLPPAFIQGVLVLFGQSPGWLEPRRNDCAWRVFCPLRGIPVRRCCRSVSESAQRGERLVHRSQLIRQLFPLRLQQTHGVPQIDHAHSDPIPAPMLDFRTTLQCRILPGSALTRLSHPADQVPPLSCGAVCRGSRSHCQNQSPCAGGRPAIGSAIGSRFSTFFRIMRPSHPPNVQGRLCIEGLGVAMSPSDEKTRHSACSNASSGPGPGPGKSCTCSVAVQRCRSCGPSRDQSAALSSLSSS